MTRGELVPAGATLEPDGHRLRRAAEASVPPVPVSPPVTPYVTARAPPAPTRTELSERPLRLRRRSRPPLRGAPRRPRSPLPVTAHFPDGESEFKRSHVTEFSHVIWAALQFDMVCLKTT